MNSISIRKWLIGITKNIYYKPIVVSMILLHAFAQKLRNGAENPKNYPYWKELISMIDEPIVQVGIE